MYSYVFPKDFVYIEKQKMFIMINVLLDSRGHLIFSRLSPVPAFLVSFFEVDIVLLLLYKIFNILDSAFCLSQYVLSLSLCIRFSLYIQLFLWTVLVSCSLLCLSLSMFLSFSFLVYFCVFFHQSSNSSLYEISSFYVYLL
jgi:hypothetical protein